MLFLLYYLVTVVSKAGVIKSPWILKSITAKGSILSLEYYLCIKYYIF